MLIVALLWLAGGGVLAATVYLALAVAASWRFRRNIWAAAPQPTLPGISVFKPLHGLEPRLETSLESFFQQQYPDFELIFGARYSDDPALKIVDALRQRYPHVQVQVVLSGAPWLPNAKICTVEKMIEVARHSIFFITDSDVEVGAGYLRDVVQPLLDPAVGLVTCIYRGVATGGFWSLLEALGMSVELCAGVLTSDMLEGMSFALGPTMAVRAEVLEQIGGTALLGNYHYDDYVLGNRVAGAGYKVALSGHVVGHIVVNRSFADSIRHQVRWMKSARFSRPLGHLGTGMTFAMPFGLLALVAGWVAHRPLLGAALLAIACINRLVLSLGVGWYAVRDPNALRFCWLYPVRDLLGAAVWLLSFFGNTILWRGERYRMLRGGLLERCVSAAPAAQKDGYSGS